MQSSIEQVKDVIEEDIWGNIQDFLAFTLLEFPFGGEQIKVTIGLILFVVLAFVLTSILLRLIRGILTRKLLEDDKLKFISVFRFIKYFVYVVVIIITLSSAGIDITILLTASAALFVGLGLALQELLQDVIGGIFIVLDKTLKVGDIIEINGKVGRVFEIKLRTTRALTRDDKVMIIPNHKFIGDVVFNYTQNHVSTREFVKVGVAYGSDTELVKKILLDCASQNKAVMKQPKPFVIFEDFGESALQFGLYFNVTDSFVDPKIKSDLRFIIERKFREQHITIPFPQRDVHMLYKNNNKQ